MQPRSLALLTDLYQLTMAYGYWKLGRANIEASFHLIFRQNPFHGGYTIAAGLEPAIRWIEDLRFTDEDLAYLSGLIGNDGKSLFDGAFLDFLRQFEFTCDVDAMPEGTIVFPQEPLVRVTGPLWQGQILETALLNIINFQSLIATKASRVCSAAGSDAVIEFGLRRAQGMDGGLSASRAAYIGGCAGTSNLLAGKSYGIPVMGTHAHSWVMSFGDEQTAFDAYAQALPNNGVFLVDTYNTLDGIRRAIETGKRLREAGHEIVGIRLDSGDLAYLNIEARRLLDDADFPKASIVASNDLDEHIITSLKMQGAKINVWGVGTRLATAYDQPALGGVYKLSATRKSGEEWKPCLKLSEQTLKVSTPGILQVKRFSYGEHFVADMIYDVNQAIRSPAVVVDPADPTRRRTIEQNAIGEDVLVPVFRKGRLVYQVPTLAQTRHNCEMQLSRLHPTIRRLLNPHEYPAGLEAGLDDMKMQMLLAARDRK